MIPGTKEFFIAVVDHDEWGGAHTVWGEASSAAPTFSSSLLLKNRIPTLHHINLRQLLLASFSTPAC